ncbi:hypothetical protein L1049_004088 [Liquidambar formosana]|uniref:Uncharacterized protein n=1 Tax=Liquidambar formosana TaxID=63359 RepID=A0AAP0RNI0_LIQFO
MRYTTRARRGGEAQMSMRVIAMTIATTSPMRSGPPSNSEQTNFPISCALLTIFSLFFLLSPNGEEKIANAMKRKVVFLALKIKVD